MSYNFYLEVTAPYYKIIQMSVIDEYIENVKLPFYATPCLFPFVAV